MKASDRFRIASGYTASLLGVAMAVCGFLMFWGTWKQIVAAPLIIACGCFAYVLGRWQVWWVRDGRRETHLPS